MSASFSVQSFTGPYKVLVAEGNFAESLSRIEDACILADEFFRPRFSHFPAQPFFVQATEQAKSLDRMPALIEQLRAGGVNRTHHLVAIGGGILQDIASFVASVYMRGIKWSYVPTTVLAMVDSCIGGKSSINVGPYKNLIGTFHPPDQILIDPSVANTLSPDAFASGLVEAAKITFVRGPKSFNGYLAAEPSVAMQAAALERIIIASLQAKKHFIEIDEFDSKERLLLNFGHTFGHALEGGSHFAIPHGIAVGLGILCSLAFQSDCGVSYQSAAEVSALQSHLDTLIRTLPNLDQHLRAVDLDDILQRFASDKKHSARDYALIVVAADGKVVLQNMERTPLLNERIRHAVASTIERYTR